MPDRVVTCAVEWEKDTHLHHHNSTGEVVLNCGKTQKISRVVFADYGTPEGACGQGFKADPKCTSAPGSPAAAVVEARD